MHVQLNDPIVLVQQSERRRASGRMNQYVTVSMRSTEPSNRVFLFERINQSQKHSWAIETALEKSYKSERKAIIRL